jgi:hypothetical protein
MRFYGKTANSTLCAFLNPSRLSEGIIKKMKATLACLRQSDQKVASDIVEKIVSGIDVLQEACSELHPSAFVAIVRILIHAGNSQSRDRGLYLLAVSNTSEYGCPF